MNCVLTAGVKDPEEYIIASDAVSAETRDTNMTAAALLQS